MTGLRIEHFMRAPEDFEGAQYQVLSSLQAVRYAFGRNIIYPHLSDLIRLHGGLKDLLRQVEDLRQALPGTLTGVDLEAGAMVYDKRDLGADALGAVEDLIRWALPHIQETIYEGRMVYEFVEENIYIEEVGVMPSYTEEGYLIVPDPRRQQMHVLQYLLSVFTRSDERFRKLKTAVVESFPRRGVYPSPQSIKIRLLAENRDLPNPATYFFATELDFPFEATMLPVVKRKVVEHILKGGQA